MTEDWELDFHNPPRISPPQEGDMDNPFKSFFHLKPKGDTTCAHCGQMYFQHCEVVGVYEIGRSTVQKHFCSQLCVQEHQLKQMRLGL